MNKYYLLTTQPAPGLQAAVFATGAVSPMEALEDVERELSMQNVAGKVLFDLLLANGNKANRYFVGEFDGQRFKKAGIKSVKNKYTSYSSISAEVLKGHFSEVDPSLLTNAMQFALKKGIPL